MGERAGAGKRWTEQEARRALAGWRRSGLSAAEYGRTHGVQGQRLSWWSKRLGGGSTSSASVRLVPAEVVAEPGVRERASVIGVNPVEYLADVLPRLARRVRVREVVTMLPAAWKAARDAAAAD